MSDTDSSSNPEDLIESDAGPDELDESDDEQPDDELRRSQFRSVFRTISFFKDLFKGAL